MALFWMQRLVGIAVVLQTLELFRILPLTRSGGVWSWNVLKKDFETHPAFIRGAFDFLLDGSRFKAVLWIRLMAALLIFVSPDPLMALWIPILLVTTALISWRWRGSFNGGSDSMTLVVLLCLSVATIFQEHGIVVRACLWYVGLQICLSYFIAGVAKLRQRSWWNGQALSGFLLMPSYGTPVALHGLCARPALIAALSWGVILFELTFPLALVSPELCSAYIALALLFHLGNVYAFGLNRFLWAWAAAYPALLYCSQPR